MYIKLKINFDLPIYKFVQTWTSTMDYEVGGVRGAILYYRAPSIV